VSAPDVPAVPIDTAADAVAWLDAEVPSLLAAAEYAATRTDGSALFGLRLCRVIQWWLGKRADWPTELAFAGTAELAATRAGDDRQRAIAATLVGRAQLHLGRREQAAARLERALAAFRGLGEQHQVMSLLSDLGQVARLAGDYPRALEHFDASLGELCDRLRSDEMIWVTADHGNDPTTAGTDHTREYTPLLVAAGVIECLAGVLVTFGLFTRLAAGPIIVFMIVAIVSYHWENGYNWESRGIEYPLFWAIAVFHFLVHGGGRWSADALIGREI